MGGDVGDGEFVGDVLPEANKPVLSAVRCGRTLGGEMSEQRSFLRRYADYDIVEWSKREES